LWSASWLSFSAASSRGSPHRKLSHMAVPVWSDLHVCGRCSPLEAGPTLSLRNRGGPLYAGKPCYLPRRGPTSGPAQERRSTTTRYNADMTKLAIANVELQGAPFRPKC
jgi:hypothetical protein